MSLGEEIAQLEEKHGEIRLKIADEKRSLDKLRNERDEKANGLSAIDETRRGLSREVAELTKASTVVHDERSEHESERDAMKKDIAFFESKKNELKSKIIEAEASELK